MIRKATMDDIDIINKLGSILHDNFVNVFHMETEIDNKDAIILVYEDINVVAYLYAINTIDNIDLLSIVVDDSYKRNGIATKLVNYLIGNYCYRDKTITLEVDVYNIPALKFYEKLGFKLVNVRKKYYNDHDAYLMKWGIE